MDKLDETSELTTEEQEATDRRAEIFGKLNLNPGDWPTAEELSHTKNFDEDTPITFERSFKNRGGSKYGILFEKDLSTKDGRDRKSVV